MTGGTAIVRRRDEGEEDEEEIEDEEGTRRGTMGGQRSGGELPREIRLIVLKVFDGNMACKRALIEIIY